MKRSIDDLLGPSNIKDEGQEAKCGCHKCVKARDALKPPSERVFGTRMIVCPECGNKRCPRAADHNNICTHSNEAGQPGSAYA